MCLSVLINDQRYAPEPLQLQERNHQPQPQGRTLSHAPVHPCASDLNGIEQRDTI